MEGCLADGVYGEVCERVNEQGHGGAGVGTLDALDYAPTVGDRIGDAQLASDDGRGLSLTSLWEASPVTLVFLRALEHDLCVDHAIQLRDGYGNIQQAGGDLIAVSAAVPPEAAAFREKWTLPYRVVCDPLGQAYALFGVSVERPGSFVIDTTGVIRFVHRSKDLLDNPSTWSLIDVTSALTGRTVDRPDPIQDVEVLPDEGALAVDRHVITNYHCAKCGSTDCEVFDIPSTAGMMSRMLGSQNHRFSAVSCLRCFHTEFYKTDSSALRNVFDLFAGA
jgi:predicted nucleic-acid-binding Zn-ribbon protein/peroxiredoxin